MEKKHPRPVPFSGQVKLVISDIDFTFLDSAKTVTPGVADAIRKLGGEGIPFAFATGRMYKSIRPWVRDLGLSTPQIVHNGAQIIMPGTERELAHFSLNHATILWLTKFAETHGYTPVYFASNDVLSPKHMPTDQMLARNNEFVELRPAEYFLDAAHSFEKVLYMALDADVPALHEHTETMKSLTKPAGVKFTAMFSEPGILNIVAPEATKINAIEALCRHYGVTLGDVMAVGDGDNDAEMLANVGLGVAMGNATELTRSCSSVQVSDCDHDGLAEAIKKYCL